MDNADSVGLRVFSLNCWGIHYLSKHCPQRYDMIGDMLCKEEHDIVLLQEVWSEKDYLSLKQKLGCSHPHSHYFKSGVIGSGLAIFSKHRIHDTFLYRYSLNGYPYMAHHGDWFGGKAVGMAVLKIGSLTAIVYVTHGCEDGMTLIADNPFISKKDLAPFEKGIRIDYIMFKGSSKVAIYCDLMSTTTGSVPEHPFPYSDHEALTAELRLETHAPTETESDRKSGNPASAAGKVAELVDIVTEARTEVKVGLHCAERMRYTATRTGVMGLALLFLELAIAAVPWLALGAEQPFPRTSFYMLAALCFAILLTTFLLYIFYTMELKSLQGAEDQMRLAVGSLQEKLRGFPLAQPHNTQRRPPEGLEPSAFDPEE
uniref:sphingomyelin phosphodiesterase n=1 Tax=Dicentrarchus labrax TaxID=13489 RepID=E6ZEY9_DICLA|nr:Sphingomyelin phosphodiesterase 2 [Dicentrarchus labrax]